jgi:hypothetical protein
VIGPFIFLDIDGVLNAHKQHANGYNGLDLTSVAILNGVLDRTGASIVVSSAWRYLVHRGDMTVRGLGYLLGTHGLNNHCVVDVLGLDQHMICADRGELILEWFRTRFGKSHSVNYLVLDDMDLGYSKLHMPFFKTKGDAGLAGSATFSDIEDWIKILKPE